jgi:D-glucuronyl C5-epimerase C-terminus
MHVKFSPQRWREIEGECSIASVRGRLFGLLLAALVMFPASAAAAPVLVMGGGGHVVPGNDPYVAARALTPAPAGAGAPVARTGAAHTRAHASRSGAHASRAERTVRGELTRLYRTRQISGSAYRSYSASFNSAVATAKRLGGTRGYELEAVVQNLHGIAVAGALTASRLPALFLTLERNRQWWSSGPLLSSGQRVEFTGSQLVWEYYPSQGIELQVLGTFGKADGLYTAGPSQYPNLRQLLSEMIPLAAQRGGGLTWEYYFNFDGGAPPWTSAMSQGTALEALTRASKAFGQSSGSGGATSQPPSNSYLRIAQRALPIFTVAPPVGVRVSTALGARYLQYTFTPGTDIINAFLQSLIGLYDYAHVSGNGEAQRLFAAGDAQARAELPQFVSGDWSLYQPGVQDPLDYHTLVTGFLDELCTRTSAPVYCTTAKHFHADLTTPPALQLLTARSSPKTTFAIRFSVSKYAHVGIVVVRGGSTVFLTSGYFSSGVSTFAIPALTTGTYTIRLAATDLPGNFNRIVGQLQVSK